MKILICFFTEPKVLQSFIVHGALFHSNAASFMKVCDCMFVGPLITISGLFEDLSPTLFISSLRLGHWIGYPGMLIDFQTSNNLICALSWLIDNRLVSLNIVLVFILSNNVEPCKNLANLFWVIWRLSKRASVGSLSICLTLPNNCSPYLIFEV